jgi:hypothetical protein
MSEADYAELVIAAHRTVYAPVIIIWDNLDTSGALRSPEQQVLGRRRRSTTQKGHP